MVKHVLTDAGRTRVVHLDRAEQCRIGRQNEQSADSSEAGNEHVAVAGVSSRDAESRDDGRRDGLSGSSLRLQEHSG